MDKQIFCNILFKLPGGVLVNNVDFHKEVLEQKEYFSKLLNFNSDEKAPIILLDSFGNQFSKQCLIKFKAYMHCQPVEWEADEFDLFIEYIKFSKMFNLKLDKYEEIYNDIITDEIAQYIKFSSFDYDYDSKFPDRVHRIYMQSYINIFHLNEDVKSPFLPHIISLLSENTNHGPSQYLLAFCYEFGIQTLKNQKKARLIHQNNWSRQNYEPSKRSIDRLSDEELYCEFRSYDRDKILEFMHKERKMPLDQDTIKSILYHLGLAYQFGVGVKKNQSRAAEIQMDNLIKNNCDKSLHACAYYSEYGIGMEWDLSKAIEYYNRLIITFKKDYFLESLGLCYIRNGDEKKGFECLSSYNTKTNFGNSYLGMCYEYGLGVPVDKKEAIKFYEKGLVKHEHPEELLFCLYLLAETKEGKNKYKFHKEAFEKYKYLRSLSKLIEMI